MIIFARCVMSWFVQNPYNKIWQILLEITDPVLNPVRKLIMRYIPALRMIDISPIIVVFLLNSFKPLIITLLRW
jgi:YggT family protein